ncbi:unnamed protein product [Phytomonas sp. Hart1]|nr:unnamed protein product [Phytomonas sp. Hart1]|eukprot:CCW66269.1 unnamed protein product [Phytomonas sp. isolate Hart1]
MRRSVFYMGRSFTRRHLNTCRSPLATGYIRPTCFSFTTKGLASSPLLTSVLLSSCNSSGSLLPSSGSMEGNLSQILATVLSQRSLSSIGLNVICIRNIAMCIACERVLCGVVSQSLIVCNNES